MARKRSFADEARFAVDHLVDQLTAAAVPNVRLGVTGLSRAGKTVFITSLVHNLLHGGRLPLFEPHASRRLGTARLLPQPDDAVPRFDYETHVRDLVERRIWPQSTRRVSELRVEIEYRSAVGWKRTFGAGKLYLDIVDYPGEWLLDLSLLGKSYRQWSAEAVALAEEPHRQPLSAEWREMLQRRGGSEPESEEVARDLAARFTSYLKAARADEHALSMLPPGRFLMPGDMEGSPALTFSPLLDADAAPFPPGSLGTMMERRYEAYRAHVVKPFFREHFARLDRQIVLVDMLAALNAGPAALKDLESALADVLQAFRPGRLNWLSSILSRRIDRILFAATKADHVHHGDHERLAGLLARLTARAAERARFAGAEVRFVPLAAVRATRELTVTRDGVSLPALAGVPLAGEHVGEERFDGETEIALFPGDLSDDFDGLLDGGGAGADDPGADAEALRYLRFKPPTVERTAEGLRLSLPHIRLDQTLQFLLGDRLA